MVCLFKRHRVAPLRQPSCRAFGWTRSAIKSSQKSKQEEGASGEFSCWAGSQNERIHPPVPGPRQKGLVCLSVNLRIVIFEGWAEELLGEQSLPAKASRLGNLLAGDCQGNGRSWGCRNLLPIT